MSTVKRIWLFIAVGSTAAAVHLAVVVGLVSGPGMPPLLANIVGWLLAFLVSFLGQWQLTFRARGTSWQRAMPRFFLLSLTGFLINEGAYAALLHWSALPYDALLALILIAVAVMTYLLSSRWAFLGKGR